MRRFRLSSIVGRVRPVTCRRLPPGCGFEFDQHAEILPWNRFNSMGEGWYCPGGGYAPGDFVRHLAGQFVDFDLEELNKNETDYNNNKYEFLFRKLMGPESKCCQASCELAVSLLTGGLHQ